MHLVPRRLPTIAIVLAALAAPLGASAAPPASLFKHGSNLCKTVSPRALGKAGGASFGAGSFDGLGCTWSTADGDYVVMLSAHPAVYTAVLDSMRSRNGKNGEKVFAVKVPGASRAVEDAQPFAQTHRYAKDLFAVYSQGVVQLSMNYKTALRDAKVIAVMRLVTHS